jgi:hypothetical protein
MAETQRTLAALLALLADNTTGAISPEDVRDIVETLREGHGEMYVSSSSATSFSDSTSFVNLAGTYTLDTGADLWDMNTNGQLRYTGPQNRWALVEAVISMTSSTGNQVLEFALGLNGTAQTPTIQSRKIGTGSDVGAIAVAGLIEVANLDYLTIMVKNTSWTAAETVTGDFATIIARDSVK